jgi:ferredoxin
MCRATAPSVFVASSTGQSVASDSEEESLETVLEAAAVCPVGAIFVEDAETREAIEF